jgi:hypothetical protein
MFLHHGEEVFLYPAPTVRINLKGRTCIAGLRKGIVGMRVGGARTVIIAPHLAYGAEGVPGKVPADALLRCELELLEVRPLHSRSPEDFHPGMRLHIFSPGEAARNLPRWQFAMGEDGRCGVFVQVPIPGYSWRYTRGRSLQWQLDSGAAEALIEGAIALPDIYPDECLGNDALWADSTEPANSITRDRNKNSRCITISVFERDQQLASFALKENSTVLEALELYTMIQKQIEANHAERQESENTGLSA